MKKIILIFAFFVTTLSLFGQLININDCTTEELVIVGDKYTKLIGKKIDLYTKLEAKRTVKILSVTLTPTKCNNGTIKIKYRTSKPKNLKFYSMDISIKERGTTKTYTIGYQVFLAMLKSENSTSRFTEKLNNNRYKIALDKRNNSLYLISK